MDYEPYIQASLLGSTWNLGSPRSIPLNGRPPVLRVLRDDVIPPSRVTQLSIHWLTLKATATLTNGLTQEHREDLERNLQVTKPGLPVPTSTLPKRSGSKPHGRTAACQTRSAGSFPFRIGGDAGRSKTVIKCARADENNNAPGFCHS